MHNIFQLRHVILKHFNINLMKCKRGKNVPILVYYTA